MAGTVTSSNGTTLHPRPTIESPVNAADVAIDVPAQVLHGSADRILPITATGGQKLAEVLPDSRLVVVEGGPHCLLWTHAEEVDQALLEVLG